MSGGVIHENFFSTEPNFLGALFVESVRGGENCSFEYDAEWLKSSSHYLHLDPDLQLYEGRQSPAGKKMCSDCSPTLLQTVEAVCS